MMAFIGGFDSRDFQTLLYGGLILVVFIAYGLLLSSPNAPSWLKEILEDAPKVIGGVILFAFVVYFLFYAAAAILVVIVCALMVSAAASLFN